MQVGVLPPVGLTVPDWWRPGLEEVSGQPLALQVEFGMRITETETTLWDDSLPFSSFGEKDLMVVVISILQLR